MGITVLHSLIYLSIQPDALSAAMPTAVSDFKAQYPAPEIALARLISFNAVGIASQQGLLMKLFICVAILLFVPSYGRAATDINRACVLRATEALPKVAGLRVKRSGTRSMPPEQLANWKGQSKPIIVDIDTVAPGVAERYSYLCAGRSAGAAFVQRILE